MALLRVVLDQLSPGADPELADVSRALLGGLVETAPQGCEIEAIVPAGAEEDIPGVVSVRRLPLARRELSASWQLGVAPGVGGGMIHAATPLAPLVRHDRVNDRDQTVSTLWDLRAWDAPESLPKRAVVAQRALLRRAVRHADAVVVPAHAMADRLGRIAALGDRIRVIAGAPDPGSALPADAVARRAGLPERYAIVTGAGEGLEQGFAAVRDAGDPEVHVVVLDVPDGGADGVVDTASALGLPAERVHVRGRLDGPDRAAVLAGAAVLVATDPVAAWPWRLVEAMALGVPIVALAGGVHHDVLADGGAIVSGAELADAVGDALGDGGRRLSVLAADRARAFSWAGAAERVWALHADL